MSEEFKEDIESNDFTEQILEREEKQEKKSNLEVLKELFTKQNIEVKTELSINQIIVINKKRTLSKLLDFKELDDTINDFMFLSVSKDRKGRAEFIDGFKGRIEKVEDEEQKGFFDRLVGK